MSRTTTELPTGTWIVDVMRSGGWWAISVPALPGVFSQCRRLEQAEEHAREAIALGLDIEPDSVTEVDLRIEPPADVAEILGELEHAETEAREAADRATRLRRKAAAALAERGFPMRDIGRLIGVSHQRVSQILADTD